MAKVALAYSGRLEGALCIRWLKEERGLKVITFSAGLGQPKYLEPLGEKALEIGADAAIIADLRERFVRDFIFPTLRARDVRVRLLPRHRPQPAHPRRGTRKTRGGGGL